MCKRQTRNYNFVFQFPIFQLLIFCIPERFPGHFLDLEFAPHDTFYLDLILLVEAGLGFRFVLFVASHVILMAFSDTVM